MASVSDVSFHLVTSFAPHSDVTDTASRYAIRFLIFSFPNLSSWEPENGGENFNGLQNFFAEEGPC